MTVDFQLVTIADADNPDVWDLALVNGDLALVSGTEGVSQHARQRLQLFLGEWFIDRAQGVPWFQRILNDGTNQAYIESVLRRVIEGTPGISTATVTAFTFDGGPRSLSISYDAATNEGEPITENDFQPLVL